jgi:hypothetical protein
MLILRFTTKAFQKFGKKPQLIEFDRTEKDFGQWYVNTVDSVKRGNLFMTAMHTESLYAMLVPIEKDMGLIDYVHTFFANLLLRILRLEVPRKNAEQIMNSYNGQAIFAKTHSKSLVANLATIVKDIDARLEYPADFVQGNQLELNRLEDDINDIPRTLNGGHVWPLDAFYECIRLSCPELPFRKSLPFKYQAMGHPEKLMDIFNGRVSENVALKIKASSLGAQVLFSVEEARVILKAAEDSHRQSSNVSEKIYSDLLRMLTFQVQKFEKQVSLE